MAINDRPDIRCEHLRHGTGEQAPRAVAVVRYGKNVQDRPFRCQGCVDQFDRLGGDWDVAYLDPTRQRRPQPDPDPPTLVDRIIHNLRAAHGLDPAP